MKTVLLALGALGLAGCTFGGGSASIDRDELRGLVLQPADVPGVFVQFDHGRQIGADAPGGTRAAPGRFGRVEGWKARYRRPGSPSTEGPLVIESRADLFESAGGAEDDFDAALTDLRESTPGWSPIDEPGIGDESFAATHVQEGGTDVRWYQVFWRDDNVTASLVVSGFDGKLALADALALARKQQRRVARAAA